MPGFPSDVLTPPETVQLMELLAATPVSAGQIREQTECNPVLAKLKLYVQKGWPVEEESSLEFLPFPRRKEELSLHDGCLLWGTQVVVPPNLHAQVLDELHEAHPGVSRMKNLAW